ncbi:hypothetical protein RchiOBHm_Chr1g0363961 [Rosa chinensis]|uniref:Uncharacterized protein n=1 Tax=Rosa chinensis TaxID=74649 RepID=A0A2P6SJM8_ROSCH|nr:hypothetical protein RchiOBHm_Chr1g0363961 [Rosa chinensis]
MESHNPHFEAPVQDSGFAFEQDQEEDALSLCDLPLHEHSEEESPASVSEPEDFFEFAVDPVYGYYPMDIVFCGKSIPCSKPMNKQFGSRSESFKLGHCPSSQSHHVIQEHKSLKSKSSNSRKHLIGLVKYHQQEMDLNEIRKRQGRRAPVAMFPVNGGEKPEVKSEGKGQSGVMRPLRCRSHLLSALAKAALGCIPHV